jgi:hypothetical protein
MVPAGCVCHRRNEHQLGNVQLGVMITGRIVCSGEYLDASLPEKKRPDDPWHFSKKEPWDKASPANAIVRDIVRDCLMAQKVQRGVHLYDQHECATSMGRCAIAATAPGSPLETGDAYRMGEQICDRSLSRWEDVHRNWKRLHGSSPWTEGNLPKARNFLRAPYEIPWELNPWMKCEPGSLTVRITPSRQDITPRWLLIMGLMKRLDTSITIGESVIMNGEGRNREIRSALLHLWITHQEINYGSPGMVMQACKIAMDARSNSETSSPMKWPGMEATTKQFDTSVNAVLNEEQDAGSTLVINGRLPSESENIERMRKWRFCAKEITEKHHNFSVATFFVELRKVVSTRKNALSAWLEAKNSD